MNLSHISSKSNVSFSYLEKQEKVLIQKLNQSKTEIYNSKVALASYAPGEDGIDDEDSSLQNERQQYLKILGQLNKVKAIKKQKTLKKVATNKQVLATKIANADDNKDSKNMVSRLKQEYSKQISKGLQNLKPSVVDSIIY